MRWLIGDIHGCREELEEMLSAIGREDLRPEIFTTGDVIGKGSDSLGALRLIAREGISPVLGNHEDHFLKVVQSGEVHTSRYLDSLGLGGDLDFAVAQISRWPLFLQWEDLDLVHAGLQPGVSRLEEMSREIVLTIRTWDGVGRDLCRPSDPAWFDVIQWPRTVAFGHWAYPPMPPTPAGFVGLDTGCVYGRSLTAWCVEENRKIAVQAHKVWAPGRK